MRRDQDPLVGPQLGHDHVIPVGQRPLCNRQFYNFTIKGIIAIFSTCCLCLNIELSRAKPLIQKKFPNSVTSAPSQHTDCELEGLAGGKLLVCGAVLVARVVADDVIVGVVRLHGRWGDVVAPTPDLHLKGKTTDPPAAGIGYFY